MQLPPMTLAELFDMAIRKVESQTVKSYDEKNDRCLYRYEHEEGTSCCFFGAMFADEYYQQDFDYPVALMPDERIIDAIYKSTGIDLSKHFGRGELLELQSVHDCAWEPGKSMRDLIPDGIKEKVWPTYLRFQLQTQPA